MAIQSVMAQPAGVQAAVRPGLAVAARLGARSVGLEGVSESQKSAPCRLCSTPALLQAWGSLVNYLCLILQERQRNARRRGCPQPRWQEQLTPLKPCSGRLASRSWTSPCLCRKAARGCSTGCAGCCWVRCPLSSSLWFAEVLSPGSLGRSGGEWRGPGAVRITERYGCNGEKLRKWRPNRMCNRANPEIVKKLFKLTATPALHTTR